MTKKWRRVYAWVLTVAMVLSMANLPITIAKAASTQNLTVKSGATSVTIAKKSMAMIILAICFLTYRTP